MDLEKIHKVVTWAAEGLENVSVSQVEMRSELQMYDGIRTEDIHDTMIKAAADLISEETPDYQYLGALGYISSAQKGLWSNLSHRAV